MCTQQRIIACWSESWWTQHWRESLSLISHQSHANMNNFSLNLKAEPCFHFRDKTVNWKKRCVSASSVFIRWSKKWPRRGFFKGYFTLWWTLMEAVVTISNSLNILHKLSHLGTLMMFFSGVTNSTLICVEGNLLVDMTEYLLHVDPNGFDLTPNLEQSWIQSNEKTTWCTGTKLIFIKKKQKKTTDNFNSNIFKCGG